MLWKKEIIALITLVLLLLGAVGFMVYKHYESAQKEEMFQGSTEGSLTALLDQRMELKNRIDEINGQMKYDSKGPLMVLFAQPLKRLEDEAIPDMEEKGYRGIIAVSEKYFPGDEKCLSVDRMNELTEDGWEIALSCSRDTDICDLYGRVKAAGMEKPVAVYYSIGSIEPDTAVLNELKIKSVIRYNRMPDYYVADGSTDIDYMFAYGCNDTGRGKKRTDLLDRGECFTYVIGFTNNRDNCADIGDWVDMMKANQDEEHFRVTVVSEAKAILKSNRSQLKKNNSELYEEREECIRKLSEVNSAIETIKGKYEQGE